VPWASVARTADPEMTSIGRPVKRSTPVDLNRFTPCRLH
jgi:hypothetical protein